MWRLWPSHDFHILDDTEDTTRELAHHLSSSVPSAGPAIDTSSPEMTECFSDRETRSILGGQETMSGSKTASRQKQAQGRREAAAVRRYLEALERHKPKRGRKQTLESIRKRLESIDAKLSDASPLEQLQLTQERIDLQKELERLEEKDNLQELEQDFIKTAKSYSDRKGIEYMAWREMGVKPDVLPPSRHLEDSPPTPLDMTGP